MVSCLVIIEQYDGSCSSVFFVENAKSFSQALALVWDSLHLKVRPYYYIRIDIVSRVIDAKGEKGSHKNVAVLAHSSFFNEVTIVKNCDSHSQAIDLATSKTAPHMVNDQRVAFTARKVNFLLRDE